MQESHVVNGQNYLGKEITMLLGISPGNPYFYKVENLQKMLQFAGDNSNQKILLFVTDKILEHNYKAVGGKNPERSARVKGNRLRNKCQEAIKRCEMQEETVGFVNWTHEVETSPSYVNALKYVKDLYRVNHGFHTDIREATQPVLVALKNSRENNNSDSSSEKTAIDLEEGVLYLLKELAFLSVLPDIYGARERFLIVYNQRWPIFEKFLHGGYDNVRRAFLRLHVVE